MKMGITEHDVGYSIEYDIPQQETSYDCGIYVCEYVEKFQEILQLQLKKRTAQKYVKE